MPAVFFLWIFPSFNSLVESDVSSLKFVLSSRFDGLCSVDKMVSKFFTERKWIFLMHSGLLSMDKGYKNFKKFKQKLRWNKNWRFLQKMRHQSPLLISDTLNIFLQFISLFFEKFIHKSTLGLRWNWIENSWKEGKTFCET